jgi:hypothetical protein
MMLYTKFSEKSERERRNSFLFFSNNVEMKTIKLEEIPKVKQSKEEEVISVKLGN